MNGDHCRIAESGGAEYILNFDPHVHARFDADALATYAFKDRQPIVLDLMAVLAAVEFADRTKIRSSARWGRFLHLKIPVYEKAVWNRPAVLDSLIKSITFLTGDFWQVDFVQRKDCPEPLPQALLELDANVLYVMPYSNGLDSRAVATIYNAESRGALQLVRLGSDGLDELGRGRRGQPFTRVPYKLNYYDKHHLEPSARSRGFKFSIVAGIASYLGHVPKILVPESGQTMLGPSLINYMHAYPDFRNNPRFFALIERFLEELFGGTFTFLYPRIWSTKGETIRLAMDKVPDVDLTRTRSCWMSQRQASLNKRHKQCGACPSCLLRRMSLYAAAIAEDRGTYICDDLSASTIEGTFQEGFAPRRSFVEYAIAGACQMFDFASIDVEDIATRVQCQLLGKVMKIPHAEVLTNVTELVEKHQREWAAFVGSLGTSSYLRDYCGGLN
jgi:hypothetical protein